MVLVQDNLQVCFDTAHSISFAVALLFVVVMGAVFPLLWLGWLRRRRQTILEMEEAEIHLAQEAAAREQAGVDPKEAEEQLQVELALAERHQPLDAVLVRATVEDVKLPDGFHIPLLLYVLDFILASSFVFLSPYNAAQSVVEGLLVLSCSIIFVVRRPYRATYRNFLLALVLAAAGISSFASLLATFPLTLPAGVVLNYAVAALFVVYGVILLLLILLSWVLPRLRTVLIRRRQKQKRYRMEMQVVERREEQLLEGKIVWDIEKENDEETENPRCYHQYQQQCKQEPEQEMAGYWGCLSAIRQLLMRSGVGSRRPVELVRRGGEDVCQEVEVEAQGRRRSTASVTGEKELKLRESRGSEVEQGSDGTGSEEEKQEEERGDKEEEEEEKWQESGEEVDTTSTVPSLLQGDSSTAPFSSFSMWSSPRSSPWTGRRSSTIRTAVEPSDEESAVHPLSPSARALHLPLEETPSLQSSLVHRNNNTARALARSPVNAPHAP